MAAHSTTASLWIPDLVLEIASHLSDRDISRFARCNRMSRELTMPLLFRKISIPLHKATSLLFVLDKYPHYARRCSWFTFEGSTKRLMSDQCEPLFESLAAVLLTLADNSHVKIVWWREEQWNIRGEAPIYVWKALGQLSRSLEELRIFTDENWRVICDLEYPQLRTLDVRAGAYCGLYYYPLQVMLNGLSQLEDFSLHLPLYGEAHGIDLSSYHPHLRKFSFTGTRLPSSFLNRHPTIEYLYLKLTVTDGYTLGDSDLPRLNVLCVNWAIASNTPSLLSRRPITHLQLDNAYVTTRDTTIPAVLRLVGHAHSTIRYLNLRWSIREFGQHIAECSILFRLLQHLEELTVQSDLGMNGHPLCEEDLVKVLLSLRDSTTIAHLRLIDIHGDPLSEIFLGDIGAVPATLKYLTWEIRELITYRLESREGKTVAVPEELPYSVEAGLAWDLGSQYFGRV